MTSRNQQYENRKKASGLDKLTVWVPVAAVPDFQLAAALMCENRHLVLSLLRDPKTGRFVSIHKAVTGDDSELSK